jgi:hypothetical protein
MDIAHNELYASSLKGFFRHVARQLQFALRADTGIQTSTGRNASHTNPGFDKLAIGKGCCYVPATWLVRTAMSPKPLPSSRMFRFQDHGHIKTLQDA